jgi:hypothetical protein
MMAIEPRAPRRQHVGGAVHRVECRSFRPSRWSAPIGVSHDIGRQACGHADASCVATGNACLITTCGKHQGGEVQALPRAIRHGQLAVTCRRPPDNGLHEPMRGHGAEYPGLATRDDAWESARALTPDLIAYASSRCAAARDEMPGPVRVRKCFEHGGVSGANRLLPLLRCPSTCASKCQSDVM